MPPRHIFAPDSLGPPTSTSTIVFTATTTQTLYSIYQPPPSARYTNNPWAPSNYGLSQYGPEITTDISTEYSNTSQNTRFNPLPHFIFGLSLVFVLPWLLTVGHKIRKLKLSRLFRPVREKFAPAYYLLVLASCLLTILMLPICMISWVKNKVWRLRHPWQCPCSALIFKTASFLTPSPAPAPVVRLAPLTRIRYNAGRGRERGRGRHANRVRNQDNLVADLAPPPYRHSISDSEMAVEITEAWDPIELRDRPPAYHSIPFPADNITEHNSLNRARESGFPRAHVRGHI